MHARSAGSTYCGYTLTATTSRTQVARNPTEREEQPKIQQHGRRRRARRRWPRSSHSVAAAHFCLDRLHSSASTSSTRRCSRSRRSRIRPRGSCCCCRIATRAGRPSRSICRSSALILSSTCAAAARRWAWDQDALRAASPRRLRTLAWRPASVRPRPRLIRVDDDREYRATALAHPQRLASRTRTRRARLLLPNLHAAWQRCGARMLDHMSAAHWRAA